MILLLGGTGETREIASALVGAGFEALVSTATGIELTLEPAPGLHRRNGPLTESAFAGLIADNGARAVVDATHPYALEITALASRVCAEKGVPYFRYSRPEALNEGANVMQAHSHQDAAVKAFSLKRNVLLTTGSRNLLPYAAEAKRTGTRLIARVLSDAASVESCIAAGIPKDNVITGRGPFSVEDNIAAIKKFDAGVLVTKDSGIEGGVPQKIEAAREEGCVVIVVARPGGDVEDRTWSDTGLLVEAVINELR